MDNLIENKVFEFEFDEYGRIYNRDEVKCHNGIIEFRNSTYRIIVNKISLGEIYRIQIRDLKESGQDWITIPDIFIDAQSAMNGYEGFKKSYKRLKGIK